ncbi:small heat shock protein [Methanobrevibacter arboriphilus JCM 13429 = DSM 1125]|uniref:Small heat shock protein n=2 Tax=Methanobrevibacter arboriphilus TaxID=39441 RepID=A0A1V6N1B6_METAZ|nr:Hsp20/alpha crystallin family protein [Methanobrevibacter arboriphilus]OQD58488.1 small heat shock protein [Methanobrevibacter arboriphilus JCM 13429 = DSM 1125]
MSEKPKLDKEKYDEIAGKVDKHVEKGKNVAGRMANDFGKTMDDILVNLKSFQKDFDSKISEYKETVPSKIDLDLIDSADTFYVKVNLPGVEKDEIDVEIVDKDLTITAFFGDKSEEACDGDCQFLIKGRTYGPARRTISLPNKVKMDDSKAEFSNGVLFLELPKVEVKKLKMDIK